MIFMEKIINLVVYSNGMLILSFHGSENKALLPSSRYTMDWLLFSDVQVPNFYRISYLHILSGKKETFC
jgi:hypothetical protein